ncbi:MAG: hypothetical protein TECD_00853 [Hyphomicrobiaceae bacterium hypho_1]
MLISLGFLFAVLLVCVVAPIYWTRAVRLTTQRLRHSLPMNETEIRADIDNLRAQHAVSIYKLTKKLDAARVSVARYKVEINRRDAIIGEHERNIANLEADLETKKNALHVLERIVIDCLPHLEKRLCDTRDLVSQRDKSIAVLNSDFEKKSHAFEKAMEINRKQRSEINILKSSLFEQRERAARERALNFVIYEDGTEVFKTDLNPIRLRNVEQSAFLSQKEKKVPENINLDKIQTVKKFDPSEMCSQHIESSFCSDCFEKMSSLEQDKNTFSLKTKEMEELKFKLELQEIELEKLRGSLEVFKNNKLEKNLVPSHSTVIVSRSYITALEKEDAIKTKKIINLNAKIALINDRSARQVAYYIDQLRRFSADMYQVSQSCKHYLNTRYGKYDIRHNQNLNNKKLEKNSATSISPDSKSQHECKTKSSVKSNPLGTDGSSSLSKDVNTRSNSSKIESRAENYQVGSRSN